MEVLVILHGRIIYTHVDETYPERGKDAELRFANAISAAIAHGAMQESSVADALCKFGQP